MDGQNSTRKTAGQPLTTRLLHRLKPEHFRLDSDDTRKMKHLCKERRAVLLELKAAADSNGTNVEVAVQTVAAALGMARSSVFRRLDDLKTLGLLIDQQRLGYNKPRRRCLNLARAQELLGICIGEKAERPEGLPDCVPTDLWQRFVVTMDAFGALGETTRQGTIDHLLAGLRHAFHMFRTDHDYAERYVLELIRHGMAIESVPLEWWQFTQYDCDVKGCPATSTIWLPETEVA